MESIVQVTKGSQLEDPSQYKCSFCSSVAIEIFGTTVTKGRKRGIIFRGFGVCKTHLAKLNTMLSGEFNIDEIYLEGYKKNLGKNLKLRKHPPILISNSARNKSIKYCSFPGCTNKFKGIVNKKYCDDPRCKEARKLARKDSTKKIQKDPDADNIILSKKVSRKLQKGHVLKIRCRARDKNGNRCKNTFTAIYEPKKTAYPKYCPEHRTGHRRERFKLKNA